MVKTVNRAMIEIDATGKAVGRVATEVSMILQGKKKAIFERHLDLGDSVTVKNVGKVSFTGRKFVQKDYRHHSMHPGGLKTISLKKVFDTDPAEVIRHAVYGMLPKNRRRDELMKRLKIEI